MLQGLRNRLPAWQRLILSLLCTLAGLLLITRPFASLALLALLVAIACLAMGVALLASAQRSVSLLDDGTAIGLILLGFAILAWSGITMRNLAWLTGGGLAVAGLAGMLAAGKRGGVDERGPARLRGAAHLLLGLVALAWRDVTVLVLATLFGCAVLLTGITELLAVLRGTRIKKPKTDRLNALQAAGLGLLLVAALALLGAWLHGAQPKADAFYDAPALLPAEPGVLLRAELFTRQMPAGAAAWRILYTTTRAEDEPALGSALVIAPATAAGEPRPVIAWAHGTTGIANHCAPSLLAEPLEAGAFFALNQVLEHGWVLVASDYTGLGTAGIHPYLIGEAEGRSVLDAVRAAHQLDELSLADATVVWGHSQGGGAALWTGQIAPVYAPDVNVLGVAALAPVSNPLSFVGVLSDAPGGSIFASYVLAGYAGTYPDVRLADYVRPAAQPVIHELAARCLSDPAFFVSVLTSLASGAGAFSTDLLSGPLGERLEENIPSGPFVMPLLLAQGTDDPLILPGPQAEYAEGLCTGGAILEYRVYADKDHVGLVAADSPLLPELAAWTLQRFDGDPARSNCP